MRTLSLIIVALFSHTSLLAQFAKDTDELIEKHVVGKWIHESSSFPNGDVVVYKRDLELFADGSGVCTKYLQDDTLTLNFNWEVKDSVVYIFVMNKFGKRVDTDSHYITYVDEVTLLLDQNYGPLDLRKNSYYRKESQEMAKY
ncbi:MAG: hypothetical protein HUJ25_03360 [Crocinitomicaceae bacterium]|nr:hypothetical protein [Crocinitomicaceae bacterium]